MFRIGLLVRVLFALLLLGSFPPVCLRAGSGSGGLLDGGLLGHYFANADLQGEPAFDRRDVRLDFEWPAGVRPGGSASPRFAAVGAERFSVRWSGRFMPRKSGVHRLVVEADDGVRLDLRREGEATYMRRIDAWSTPGRHVAEVTLDAGVRHELRIEYRQDSGPARMRLLWSGPGFAEEVLDVASLAALNMDTYADEIWANAMDGARDEWRDPGFGEDRATWPQRDPDGWPRGDGAIIVWEGAEPASVAGTYRLSFEGRARAAFQGVAGEFFVDGRSVGNVLPFGVGWDAASNRTVAEVRIQPLDILFLYLTETRRSPSDTAATGVRRIALERPESVGSAVPQPAGSRFDVRALRAFGRYSALRWISNFETERTWSDRVRPAYSTHRDVGSLRHWELMVQLSNETGKDLYACIPHRADDDYVRKVARLIRNGSDGGDPYDAPRVDPVHPPLNPNLRVYLERGNEIWNFSFSQGPENAEDGRREVVLGTEEGRILDFDGMNPTGDSFYRWHALRSLRMSRIFRSEFGDGAMGTRVRFLLEYQYDNFQGTAETAFDFLDRYFNNADGVAHVAEPHPVRRDFWGGGGAVYYSSGNPQGTQSHTPVVDGGFEAPVLADGAPVALPAGSGWNAQGTAGLFGRRSAPSAFPVQTFGPVIPAPDVRRLLGLRFTTGATPLAVYELGRRIPHGPKRDHDLWLLRASDRSVVAQGRTSTADPLVDVSSVVRLATPALLEPNTSYLLLSSEDQAGDTLHGTNTVVTGLHGITIDGAVRAEYGQPDWDPATWTVHPEGPPGSSYGPLVMGVVVAANPPLAGFPPDPPQGAQGLWLAGTSSVSRVVNFALPGTYALRFQAAARPDRETGVFFEIDGRNITPRAASHEGPVGEHWVPGIGFNRDSRRFENNGSFVFEVAEAGPKTLRITSTGYPRYFNPFEVSVDPDRAVYFDAFEVVSVDALFAGGIPSGGEANGQPSERLESHAAAVASQARYAQAFGLEVVAYEGGWSLGGDFGAVPIQNWAKFRDPRARRTAVDSMDLFARSGGALYTWGTYTTWPRGSMQDAGLFPLTIGVDEHGSSLPPEPSNGVDVPARLTTSAARWALFAEPASGRISGPGGWIGWNLLARTAGEYRLEVATTNAGRLRVVVDGLTAADGVDAGGIVVLPVRWGRGLHSVRVQALSGEPVVRSLDVALDGTPDSPALRVEDGDGRITLRWSEPTSGPVPTGYEVRYGTTSGNYPRSIDVGAARESVVTGLSNGVPHYFAVFPRNEVGQGRRSAEVSATPFADGERVGLVAFEFTGAMGNEVSLAPGRSSSRVVAGPVVRGPGLVPTTYLDLARNTFGSEARGDRYAQDLAASMAAGQHYEWTVAPSAGRRLTLEALRFRPYFQNVFGGETDPRSAGVSVSTNGRDFVAVAAVGTPTFDGNGEFVAELGALGFLAAVADPVVLRIHLFGNEPFEFTGLGGVGDDVVLEGRIGSPVVVPKPLLAASLEGTDVVLRFQPRPGVDEVLERSVDLDVWVPVSTGVLPDGRREFHEEPGGVAGFFRIRP